MAEIRKHALIVGCNYKNSRIPELKGCHNDALQMRMTLINRFGFRSSCIDLMIDTPDTTTTTTTMPTGAKIKRSLRKMADNALPGDILFFHFSGHGTRLPKPHERVSVEAIVPCDGNVITTVDFRYLLGRLPQGVKFTILCDSCNTGALIDKQAVEIGRRRPGASFSAKKPRFVAYEYLLFWFAAFKFPLPLRADQGILLSDELSYDNENGYGELSRAIMSSAGNIRADNDDDDDGDVISNREVMERLRMKHRTNILASIVAWKMLMLFFYVNSRNHKTDTPYYRVEVAIGNALHHFSPYKALID